MPDINAFDADFVQLFGDGDLVVDGKHDAGRLLAVPQRRVMDFDPLRSASSRLTSGMKL